MQIWSVGLFCIKTRDSQIFYADTKISSVEGVYIGLVVFIAGQCAYHGDALIR